MAKIQPGPVSMRIGLGEEPKLNLGGLRVFPAELAVEFEDRRRELQPRVMRVLVALAKAMPNVVSRDRLIEECWDGRIVGDDAINRCILSLRHLAGEFEPAPFAIKTVPRVGHRLVVASATADRLSDFAGRPVTRIAAGAGMLAALVAAILLAGPARWPWLWPSRDLTVQVVPSNGGAASKALAQQLAVNLGSLIGGQQAAIRLVGSTGRHPSNADLILQVGLNSGHQGGAANVAIVDPTRSTMLWSRELQGASNDPDLEQRIAVSAGRALNCAGDAMGARERPGEQGLQVYLNACAALADAGANTEKIIPTLRGLLAERPRFVPGWAQLLQAETLAFQSGETDEDAARKNMRRDIASARRYEPNLAEAYIAEYLLMPPADFVARSRILDTAVARNPGHAEARDQRSIFLQSVGRTNAAIADARKAVDFDPLSPQARDGLIALFAEANQMDAARGQLAEAERLWPGAGSVVMARYRLELRFLRLLRSGAVQIQGAKMHETFLEARIAPTPENVERAVDRSRNTLSFDPQAIDSYLQTLAEFHRNEELLSTLLNWRRMDMVDSITGVLFRPAFDDLHRDPRFMKVADHLGLRKYWRATGRWPDFCFAADLPYDCRR